MYQVMMRCPNSLDEGPLGMEVEGPETWDAITFVKSLYLCASCGQTHLVNKQYARLYIKGRVLPFKRTHGQDASRPSNDVPLRVDE
jgi:hypothetical protein